METIEYSQLEEINDKVMVIRPLKIYSRKRIEQGFLEAFELVGGVSRLALWANEEDNYKDFLQLLVKFGPKESIAEVGGRVLEYRSNIPSSPLNKGGSIS